MADDTMIVTMTVEQLKNLLAETVTDCLSNTKQDPNANIEIRYLKDLQKLYGISVCTASKWKQALERAGLLQIFGRRWWITKGVVDKWLKE